MRVYILTDSEDPRCEKSSIDTEEPILDKPSRDIEEPPRK
jgi:hypothetical protein